MSFSQDDILTLAKAGFTANQIIALGSIQTPAPAPVAPAPVAPAPDPFQQLFEQMTGIKQAIQSNNIQNSSIVTQPQTTDDILASIIQPTKKEETK